MRSFGIFAALAAFSSVFAAPTLEAKNALKRRDDIVDMHTACKVYKMYGFLQDANNQAQPIASDSTITSSEKASKIRPILTELSSQVYTIFFNCDATVDNSREAVIREAGLVQSATNDLNHIFGSIGNGGVPETGNPDIGNPDDDGNDNGPLDFLSGLIEMIMNLVQSLLGGLGGGYDGERDGGDGDGDGDGDNGGSQAYRL